VVSARQTRLLACHVLLTYLPSLAGCGGEDARSSGPLVRDSAGVRILENKGPRWPGATGWRLSQAPVLDIGVLEGDANYQLYRVTDARRLSDGRVVAANSGTNELRFYDAAGRYLSTAGREGGGPGEFQGLFDLWTLAEDSLLTYDFRNHRVSLFNADGEFVRSFDLHTLIGAGVSPDVVGPFADGSLLVAGRQSFGSGEIRGGLRREPNLYLRCDPEGARVDSLGRFPGDEWYVITEENRMMASTRAFGRRPVAAVHGDAFYFGHTDSYELAQYDQSGRLVRLIRKAQPNLPVTAEDTERLIEDEMTDAEDESQRTFIRQMYAEMPFPQTMPAYRSLVVDADGNLWVEDYRRPGDKQPRWTVFNSGGEMLGLVETPPRFTVFEIGSDFVLGLWIDDLDVEHVQLYALFKD